VKKKMESKSEGEREEAWDSRGPGHCHPKETLRRNAYSKYYSSEA
jgi:hypothetical protein